MRARDLGDPLLVTSDGAPGIIKAIEVGFPRSARQRCLAHRLRNLSAKVKLSRYEAAIERSLYKSLHELQRVQAARKDGQPPPSIAVDVTVDGPGPAPDSAD